MDDLANILKILGDSNRFQIVKILLTHDLCVGAIAYRLDISKPAVSQHLQILRKAGLVRGEKRGYWTHYAVDRAMLGRVADAIADLAQGLPGGIHLHLPDNGHCHKEENKDVSRTV
jgi:DNA-binding transcriptional ArsR family regulator